MADELKPCPWCYTNDALVVLPRFRAAWEKWKVVECQRCGVTGPPAYEGMDAGELWNARAERKE